MSYDIYENEKRLGYFGTNTAVKQLTYDIAQFKTLKALNELFEFGEFDDLTKLQEDINRYQSVKSQSRKKDSELERTMDNLLNVVSRARRSIQIKM